MKISLLAIGDEIVSGTIVDTNSQFAAAHLFAEGVELIHTMSVGDDIDAIVRSLGYLVTVSDAVLVTGGLGPTDDDMTSVAAAAFLGVGREEHPEALKYLEHYFDRLGRAISERNRRQVMLPVGCEIVANTVGTASGFIIRKDGVPVAFMPGVPSEMKTMLVEGILPRIVGKHSVALNRVETLKFFGITESMLNDRLVEFIPRFPTLKLAYLPSFPDIKLKITESRTSADISERIDEAFAFVAERVGEYIYSRTNESFPEAIVRILKEHGVSVATAESCTGGLIGSLLTDVPGASAAFKGGIISYANEAKSDLLGVAPETIAAHGAVSEQTAREMAEGARSRFASDFSVSTTGIAGPDGGTPDKPVGLVFVGLAGPSGTTVAKYNFSGRREQIRILTAFVALDTIRKTLAPPRK